MTRIELNSALKLAKVEYENKKKELYKQYRDDNAKAKIGDIVSNGTDTILVTRVTIQLFYENISIYYSGKKLRKDLKPYANGDIYSFFESSEGFKIVKKAGEDGIRD